MVRLSRPFAALVLAFVALIAFASPATTATPPAGIAVPGSFAYGYVTPAILVAPGEPILFVNLDVAPHDIVAKDAVRPNDRPWCARFQGPCPLFASDVVGTGGQTNVVGTETLTPGGQYAFVCSIHLNMTGTLVVL